MSTLEELIEEDLSERLQLKLESGDKLIGIEWRESESIPNRKVSLYTNEEALEVENQIKAYLKPHLSKEEVEDIDIWIHQSKGLSIDVPPLHQKQYNHVKGVLLEYMKEEDRKYLFGYYY